MNRPAGGGSLLLVLLLGLLWGFNWPAVKFMLAEIPPITLRAAAFLCAAPLLALIARATGRPLLPARREIAPMLLTGTLVVFGFNVLTSFGQLHTQTSKAAIIAYTMPALTAALAALLLGERLTPRLLLALAVGMGGLGVLASEDFAALAADPTGPAIMLAAALSWALGNVALKARAWSLPPLSLTVWFFVVSAALAWPLALAFEAPGRGGLPSGPVLLTFGFHVLGPMVTCYLLWTVLVGRLPATVAALSTLTAPVVGVLSAMLLLGDPATWRTLLALAMVVASIALALAPRRRPGARAGIATTGESER